ncbi:uncharacterized protein LOC127291199 [Leptopilina boulardi]|uniref:uncharacterized protein LOC127291199 n=1 Tax=Leptopilina boulardi TaxID=63433 RepID=UPI0021F61588|nr:uncharacterized protein LOC127291199 [Leptopilina boulardi]XP_051176121.1 uncharacterized protein LOC127291199 [Leptopilina boulardi]XP_051176122.1 uncharacterized protein LOC127291199 [Leptopilina boulardi]XP_051176123.1 uncharacterized protein LOC127291199 [Leptopilina boulardi]XP_051176124.1 uncharacterized protein LOC127291199 [Leptopilina boulardi]XP_051176125.1 uncharacterized protein LOC127291199 [Leptopilina boulardi]XP_051176126.1 uncharacterized protein LOC127291199 [Leptopilina 
MSKFTTPGMDHSRTMILIILHGILALCNGKILEENATTIIFDQNYTESSTQISTATDKVEGHLMDDILPGTKPPTPAVIFVDVPAHTETKLGAPVVLSCRTAFPVTECQWSWRPLPSTHFPLPEINDNSFVPTLSTTSTLTTTQATSLPLQQFPAFGNNSNDCSVRFSSTKHAQTGYWTCAARISKNDSFISTQPAKLSIAKITKEKPIIFENQDSTIEAPAGSPTQILCRTMTPVYECQWTWRRLNQSQPWNREVKKLKAFGNESNECSIKFKNILHDREGFWTCGARMNINSSFVFANPIRLLISEVEFVKLSRGLKIASGETVFLHCLVNKPVVQCEWFFKPLNSSMERTVVNKFTPSKEAEHDCSMKFKNVIHKGEGLWTCGVRLSTNGILHEAPPATVTILPTGNVSFVEKPEDTSVPIGTEAILKCVTNERVEKCAWSWRPLIGNDDEIIVHEFPSKGEVGRDCSLNLPRVYAKEQGFWSCQVSVPGSNTILSTHIVKLTMYEQEDITFSELSQDFQISAGKSIQLRCVTSSAVDQCRWSLTPVNSNTTVVVRQFPPIGTEDRDCSTRLTNALAEQEGLWTCGAKTRSQQNYTDASPAKLSLLEPEPVTVTLWAAHHQAVTLACKIGPVPPKTECQWLHGHDVLTKRDNYSSSIQNKYYMLMEPQSGVCTLHFVPGPLDFGQWKCKFMLPNENLTVELGNDSLLLLEEIENDKLGWLVGVLTVLISFLAIIIVVLVVCRGRIFRTKIPSMLETISPSERKRKDVLFKIQNIPDSIKIEQTNQNNLTVHHVLPNRSPRFQEKSQKTNPSPYENTLNVL